MGFMATIERGAKENQILSIDPEISELHNLKLLELIDPERGISQLNMHDSLVRYEMLRFLPSLLQVEDRMSMSHGLEARVPFLDKNLVEFMIKLPSNLKLSENNSKEILRKSLSGVVPDRVIQRTDKLGFPVPLLKWIKSDKIEEITLLIDSLNKHSIPGVSVNTQNISKIISKSDARELWGAMILASWLNSFE
jgi:asparagine synthase (glutamine-hydrolysing)